MLREGIASTPQRRSLSGRRFLLLDNVSAVTEV